jgi:hypothetical protein
MAAGTTTATVTPEVVPTEGHLPVPVIVAYDLLAAATLAVLLTAIGSGEADRRRPRTPLTSPRWIGCRATPCGTSPGHAVVNYGSRGCADPDGRPDH